MEKNLEGLALDAWIAAVPDDSYGLCPCGCGKKFRFVVKGGEEEIKKHAETFIKNYLANLQKKD